MCPVGSTGDCVTEPGTFDSHGCHERMHKMGGLGGAASTSHLHEREGAAAGQVL